MPQVPALEAFGVSKQYTRTAAPALSGIDLSVAPSQVVALVGPNGAGKSTLIRAWVGFERPTSGHVAVAGTDPFVDRPAVLGHLGYVPQLPALYGDLTVADHLDLAKLLRPSFDRALASRRLDDLAIPLYSPASHLSGGQQAQVGLALALGTRADILLLDEPLASLDPLARREFLFLVVRYVRDEGATALLSSHVVADVEQAADHLIVLGQGRKLLDEPIASAIRCHAVITGDQVPPDGEPVASFLDVSGEILTLVRIPSGSISADVRPATVEELMLGYLAAGRPGLVDRARAGIAGR